MGVIKLSVNRDAEKERDRNTKGKENKDAVLQIKISSFLMYMHNNALVTTSLALLPSSFARECMTHFFQ